MGHLIKGSDFLGKCSVLAVWKSSFIHKMPYVRQPKPLLKKLTQISEIQENFTGTYLSLHLQKKRLWTKELVSRDRPARHSPVGERSQCRSLFPQGIATTFCRQHNFLASGPCREAREFLCGWVAPKKKVSPSYRCAPRGFWKEWKQENSWTL